VVALSAHGAAHAFAIADLPWEVSAGADCAERLRRAGGDSVSPAAVTGDAMPAKTWSTLPPPHLLDDYCAMIRHPSPRPLLERGSFLLMWRLNR
jgi:hypothetical protein